MMAPVQKEGVFRSSEVQEIIGLTRRQLQHWDRTDLIRPSRRTPGGHSRYTFQDLVSYKAAKRLLDAGISVQKIRSVISRLRKILPKIRRPLIDLTLVATGDVVLVFYQSTVFEAITGQQWVLEVADVQQDVEKWRRKLDRIRKNRQVPPPAQILPRKRSRAVS